MSKWLAGARKWRPLNWRPSIGARGATAVLAVASVLVLAVGPGLAAARQGPDHDVSGKAIAGPHHSLAVNRFGAKLTKAQIHQAEADWYQFSHFANKPIPAGAMERAWAQSGRLPKGSAFTASAPRPLIGSISNSGHWRGMGPQPINAGAKDSGRITAIAVDTTSTNGHTFYVGAADGGVWKTTNGGTSWTPLFDNQPTLSIGAIAIDPNNHNIVYVGTGEANSNGDLVEGMGIFKSTDAGAHWTQSGLSDFAGGAIARIAVDPTNSANILVAATDGFHGVPAGGPANNYTIGGIWRSTDGGSTWSQVKADSGALANTNATDVVFDAAHAGWAYAGFGDLFGDGSLAGLWRSTDYGATWTELTNGLPSETGNPGAYPGRTSVGISHDGQDIYVAMATPGGGGDLLNGDIYVSTNGTASNPAFTGHAVPSTMANDNNEHQWWYDMYTMADPTNDAYAYIGGVDVWQTTNTGTTWTNVSDAYGFTTGVHPDQHALAFRSNASSSFYIGNDGGVWAGGSASNSSGGWYDLNTGGLNITQFYDGYAADYGPDAQIYAGAQDNGENQYPASACSTCSSGAGQQWNEVFGGDGFYTAVDWTNDALVYEEYYDGNMNCSTNGGASFTSCVNGLAGNAVNFSMPFIISPNVHTELFAGTDTVYKTTNSAGNWAPLTASPLDGSAVSAIAVPIHNDNYIYAGTDNGGVFVTSNGGSTWSANVAPPGHPAGLVTGIAVSAFNPQVAFVTYGGFTGGTGGHLWETQNAGGSWVDLSASLPDVPFNTVLDYQTNQNVIMVGTDAGAFYTTTGGGGTWYVLGNGLPNVAVDKLFIDFWETGLYAATHGRGMWELSGDTFPSPASLVSSGAHGTNITVALQLIDTGYGVISWSTTTLPTGVTVGPSQHGVILPQNHVNLTVTFNFPTAGSYNGSITLNTSRGDNPTVTIPYNISVS